MKLDTDRSALLVVDVQNDFCTGGALAVPDGDNIVRPINNLARSFRYVVFTQDWHPAGHVSFASAWPGRGLYDTVEADGIPQVLWPDHCVQGSRGAAFHPALQTDPATLILRKGTRRRLDSYSALFENDRDTATGLDGWLRSIGVTRLWLSGLAIDYCVRFTALDAIRLGYEVAVVEDAVCGVDVPVGNVGRTMDELRRLGALFVQSSDLE